MFERLSNGYALAKQSLGVLQRDKQLIIFPLLSGISCTLVMISFAIPLVMTGAVENAIEQGQEAGDPMQNPLYLAVLFAFYFVNYFVIVFFNSALIACAVKSFYGERPTLSDGISAAMSRLPQIAGWALLSATVGVILRVIESRSEKVGAIVSGLLGMAWAAASFFVVPVLVIEKAGPFEALKRSATILKSTWGESLGAKGGIGFFGFLASLPCIALIVGGGFLTASIGAAGIAVIVLGVIGLLLVSLISSAMSAIVQAAIYMYGSSGDAPGGFEANNLRGVFAKA
ncbi:hypothetical protein CA51_52440 [Rosistilla oblonga]|uniref:Glycerophosphoryl diester phosphodiesterase membrane domain-containing protein n=2 Tax=Rosistilla TaxID=2795779 RepID=A0A518ITM2_9BACT|nr:MULTISPECIES: DUF6159 family protein [Rosistilla]QDS90992.1 hypothetical protein EC9_52110 [Rosistilla ulvae]QDV15330.1 hypothetical protein CA51_52440 [Rosistilla oblonga]QDV56433.1 hypothetical protein Mal33_24230 [Rosistilla oblonga]